MHTARKRFGQHFLKSRPIINRLLNAIEVKKDDAIVEIGPGHGALTQALLEQVTTIKAIEIDRDLVLKLKSLFNNQELELYAGDALKFDFSSLYTGKPLRIVGNLPYNISTPLLFHLFSYIHLIQDMHFTLQYEIAERLSADVGDKSYSKLSIIGACFVETTLLFTIDASAFSPAPKVQSAFVRMRSHPRLQNPAEYEQLKSIVQMAFSQRRKMIKKSLSNILSPEEFIRLNINPNARVETLSLEDFINMLKYTNERTSI